MRSPLKTLHAVLWLMLGSSLAMVAQTTGGRILGQVSDPSGAVISGVKVTLTNEQTGISRSAETDKTGNYEFPIAPVGNYRLEYDQAGFKKAVKRNVVLQLNQVLTLNMTLQLGGTQEVVEV